MRDGGERLAAEAERGDGLKVGVRGQLACREALANERQVFAPDPVPVVGDLQELEAARRERDRHKRRAGVDRVLEHLLDRRGGAVNHLARRDPIDRQLVELHDRPDDLFPGLRLGHRASPTLFRAEARGETGRGAEMAPTSAAPGKPRVFLMGLRRCARPPRAVHAAARTTCTTSALARPLDHTPTRPRCRTSAGNCVRATSAGAASRRSRRWCSTR